MSTTSITQPSAQAQPQRPASEPSPTRVPSTEAPEIQTLARAIHQARALLTGEPPEVYELLPESEKRQLCLDAVRIVREGDHCARAVAVHRAAEELRRQRSYTLHTEAAEIPADSPLAFWDRRCMAEAVQVYRSHLEGRGVEPRASELAALQDDVDPLPRLVREWAGVLEGALALKVEGRADCLKVQWAERAVVEVLVETIVRDAIKSDLLVRR